jgi:hypothetical protein
MRPAVGHNQSFTTDRFGGVSSPMPSETMNSGIFFQGYRHDGTDGLVEYVLESCVQDFDLMDVNRSRPALREFFQLSHEEFYSGIYVFLDDELVREPRTLHSLRISSSGSSRVRSSPTAN